MFQPVMLKKLMLNGPMKTRRDHSVFFEIAPKFCTLDSFVDYHGYSIFSKGLFPTVVDKWSPELNSPIPVHFSSLIPKMWMFTLAVSCLTTSNFPRFMDLTFQVPMQYCSLQHQTLLPSPAHPQLGIVFILAQPLHSFWSYFSTHLQWHIGHLPTWGVHLSVSYLFAFSNCSWGSQGKDTKVVCHSLLQGTTFCQNSPPWHVCLGWPYTTWLIVSLS